MSLNEILNPETQKKPWSDIYVNKINGNLTGEAGRREIAKRGTDPAIVQSGTQTVPAYPSSTNIGISLPFSEEQFVSTVYAPVVGGYQVLKDGLYNISIQLRLFVSSGSANAIQLLTPPSKAGISPSAVMATSQIAPLNSSHNINASINVYMEAGANIQPLISALAPVGTFNVDSNYCAINIIYLGA